MAIEISPRMKIRLSVWTTIVGVVPLILLISFTAAYFYFVFSFKKISQELEEKNIVVIPLEKAIAEKEMELEPISQKMDDFNELLARHKKTIDIFTFLERTSLPTIWFSDFTLSSETGKVSLSVQADSLTTLEHQINILEEESGLRSLNITEVSVNEEGNIIFNLSLIFK